MATPLEIFRLVATEFAAVDDTTVNMWIDITTPLVSRKRFGKVYEQALALLTAHRMKIAAVGTDGTANSELDEIAIVGAGFRVAGYTSGGESVSYNGNVLTTQLSPDAEYTQTVYGVQYLTLRDLNIVSITNAGERR